MYSLKACWKGLMAMAILAAVASPSHAVVPRSEACYLTVELYNSNLYQTIYYPVGSETMEVNNCDGFSIGQKIGAGTDYAYGIVTNIEYIYLRAPKVY